jgi:hypothetical protein
VAITVGTQNYTPITIEFIANQDPIDFTLALAANPTEKTFQLRGPKGDKGDSGTEPTMDDLTLIFEAALV